MLEQEITEILESKLKTAMMKGMHGDEEWCDTQIHYAVQALTALCRHKQAEVFDAVDVVINSFGFKDTALADTLAELKRELSDGK